MFSGQILDQITPTMPLLGTLGWIAASAGDDGHILPSIHLVPTRSQTDCGTVNSTYHLCGYYCKLSRYFIMTPGSLLVGRSSLQPSLALGFLLLDPAQVVSGLLHFDCSVR